MDVSGLSSGDPIVEFNAIRAELAEHNPALIEKPTIVVATKIDAAVPARLRKLERWCRQNEFHMIRISSVTGEGLEDLKHQVFQKLS